MTQIWDTENRVVPVTVLEVSPCRIVQVKRPEDNGYSALQVTWGQRNPDKCIKPQLGHFDSANVKPGVGLLELRLNDVSEFEVGQEFGVDILEEGEKVDVTAVSKGKGFAGVMKRHGFKGQGASHGVHKVHRKPGAVGQCATPSRIFQGKKMPGRMGADKITTLNLKVMDVDSERELLLVKGSVPGPKGGVVVIRNAVKGGAVTPITMAGKSDKVEAKSTADNAADVADAPDEAAAAEAPDAPAATDAPAAAPAEPAGETETPEAG